MNKRLFAKTGLSLDRLRTFADIVAAAGISNAAPGDGNRQSQFSRQLKELEQFFGMELLRRGRGPSELTAAGRELFQIVQSQFNALGDFADRCANQNVEIALGAGESLLHGFLLPSFAAFRARHPSTTLILHNLRTGEIASRLADGRIDVGLLRIDAVRAPIKSVRLGSIQYRLVMPRNSSVPPTEKNVWPMLEQMPVALLAESEVAAGFEAAAAKKGVRLNISLRGTSYAQLVEAIQRAGCAAVIPASATKQLGADAAIFSLAALKPFARPIALAWNPRFCALRPTLAKAIETLADTIRDIFGKQAH
jgi:DNA-binding transcriptional LysR family regulator